MKGIAPVIAFFSRLDDAAPDVHRASNRFWLAVGCFATYGYALFALQFTAMDQPFLNLLTLAFAVSLFFAPKAARTDPVVYLALGAIALALFSYVQTHVALQAYAEQHPYINKILDPFTFFAVAWWLGGSERNAFRLLLLALLGFAIAIVEHGTLHEFVDGLRGERVNFGFWNAQHTAMFFSVALIGWSVFAPRFLHAANLGPAWVRLIGWSVVFLLLFEGVVITQTRAAWVGLAVAVVIGGTAWLRYGRRAARASPATLTALFVAVSITGVIGYQAKGAVESRFMYEAAAYDKVVHEDLAHAGTTSTGIRAQLWNEAIRRIEERPLIGWGYEIRARFIRESPNLPDDLHRFGHAHNSYLELLLIYGILGITFMGVLIATVTRELWRAWRAGRIPSDIMLFGICFFGFWAIANVFESYIFGKTGTFLVAVVGGVLYTFVVAGRQKLQQNGPGSAEA